ncbi:hypothetical protein POM88_002389 [Heracleum sosnowskyi]|uniref:Uncharacterized protein n=1 Tax=Heracleum sosnowskyi TaxID=360622 RepID=A0AAD8NAH0_9APIA|nr:hypothetical protein POM88_002389 [Heracleum sosnowskyi]
MIDLSFNSLSSEVASSLPLPSSVRVVDFSSNHLNNTIPSDYFEEASNLVSFNVSNNSFVGKIPQNIGKLFKLQQLRLHENNLSGPLPSTLTKCINLITVNLRVNFLDGDVTALDFPSSVVYVYWTWDTIT